MEITFDIIDLDSVSVRKQQTILAIYDTNAFIAGLFNLLRGSLTQMVMKSKLGVHLKILDSSRF